ncbi:hypothetical protein M271_25830 [Streptomyces rapamycinicus NRRL 5491]|nr:hypothetical protein M271_25830 [Streptomyces rapamycinicus NRRL 5491]
MRTEAGHEDAVEQPVGQPVEQYPTDRAGLDDHHHPHTQRRQLTAQRVADRFEVGRRENTMSIEPSTPLREMVFYGPPQRPIRSDSWSGIF